MWCRSTPGTLACTFVSTLQWRSAYCCGHGCLLCVHRRLVAAACTQHTELVRARELDKQLSFCSANSACGFQSARAIVIRADGPRSLLAHMAMGEHGRALNRFAPAGHVWTHLIDAGALFSAPPPWAVMTVVVVIICGCCTGIICGCCTTICGCCMVLMTILIK